MVLQANGTEDCSRQLFWVANQNQSLAAVEQRDETRNLYCLTRFIDYDCVKLYIGVLNKGSACRGEGAEY